MKEQLLQQKPLRSSNFLCYNHLWILFFALFSCNHQTPPPIQNAITKILPKTDSFVKYTYVAPKVVAITTDNRPKLMKAGKPVIRIDSSGVGIPFFINYNTEEGLAFNSVLCSTTDKAGNLWFGTAGGGVSKYDGKSFTNYTIANGLPSNVVYYIKEDKEANIWFATSTGLSKFDGYKFINYNTNQGLAGNSVTCIMEDKDGFLWFGTRDGGVSKYDGKTFINYTATHGPTDNYISYIMQDKSGNIWFGTGTRGVSKYDGSSFTSYTKVQGLVDNSVNTLYEDKAGNIWIGTSAGVSKYNGNNFINYKIAQGLTSNDVLCIAQDKDSDLWFGTQTGGISKYDGRRFTNYTRRQGLPDNNVSSILMDKAGNIWLTYLSGGGVSRYEGNGLTNYSIDQGLTGNPVFSILQDKSGSLWFGTYEGGVNRYDGESFKNYTTDQGLTDNLVWKMVQDKDGNIWFGTDRGGVSKFDGKNFTTYTTSQGLAGNTVYSIIQDKGGNLWFGTNRGASKFDGNKFENYSTSQGLAGNNIQCIIQDKAGNIWFATHGNGVSKYNGSTFINYTMKQGLESNTVYSILQDKNENIWFGTNEGASKYDGKSFYNYTNVQGLADNYVWTIAEDTVRDIVWFGTNKGLSALREKPAKSSGRQDIGFENFNKNTGYPIKDFSTGALFVDNKGILWAGTADNKILRFNYSAVTKKNTGALNIEIQNIKVNNENICWNNLIFRRQSNKIVDSLTRLNEMITSFGKVLSPGILDSMRKKYGDIKFNGIARFYPVPINPVLPYNNNNITIDFVAIDPVLPKQVKYQYKLEGYSNDWSPLSNSSSAVFGNMSAGKYVFKLKAVSSFGVLSGTEYTFEILPPWWFTWWAYTLYGLMGGIILFTFYRSRIRKLERNQARQINVIVATQEEERKRISRDIHDDIGTKLSSLKLFLSSLHEKAIDKNNKEMELLAENSERFVTEAMQDIRKLLLNLSPAVVEEFGYPTAIEGLINKINETKQIRFTLAMFGMKERLKPKYEIALYRITQELINNVLKHAEAKNVSLQVGRRNEKIILMMEDDGKGFDVNAHKYGYGLNNLNERTKLMKGKMTIDSKAGRGTSISIEIPYKF